MNLSDVLFGTADKSLSSALSKKTAALNEKRRIVKLYLPLLALLLFYGAPSSIGQQSDRTNPYTSELKVQYTDIRRDIIESAEKMPEEKYNFRPASEVRSFGQLVEHLVDDQYALCALARGEKNPHKPEQGVGRSAYSKVQLVQALRKAFEYCDAVYEPLTDATASQRIQSYDGTMQPRIQLLMINTHHAYLHYGNMIIYLRMNGLVPPSTARAR